MKPETKSLVKNTERIKCFPPGTAVELYRLMSLIRQVELEIEGLYHLDEMKTPVHLCIGQEAVSAGVCHALKKEDYVFSNHRGHGHYLAKGGNLKAMIAELYCRETGCSRGRGGSMHLVDVPAGLMGSSSIVAGGIPLAVGAALGSKLTGSERVAVAFFGDGAVDEGVLYESVNFALLRRLPVLFVCENNFYSVCSPVRNRHCSENIAQRFCGMGLSGYLVDGTDVVAVYQRARELVAVARRGEGPALMECRAYRWRGHAGPGSDVNLGYRTREELEKWVRRCPLKSYAGRLVASGILKPEEIEKIDFQVKNSVKEAFNFARESPLPDGGAVTEWLFSPERR